MSEDVVEPAEEDAPGTWLRVAVTVVACLVLVAAAGGATYWIYTNEPEAQRETQTRRSAAPVETMTVTRGDYQPRLRVLGTVEPARDIMLSPRVGGQIVDVSPDFEPGGIIMAGDPIVRLDPADYEQALRARQSELDQAEAELAIEEGMQAVARQEFELLGGDIAPGDASLALREPQIRSIRARVDAAQAAVAQAQLALDRVNVVAPFDAKVLDREANLGSQVAPGQAIGRIVGIDHYWVTAGVPLRDLQSIDFAAETGDDGSPVQVRQTTAWPEGVYREGRVSRLVGRVDEMSRLARVLVRVPDPLARNTDGPQLVLGTIVELSIAARPLTNVVRLDRQYLRQNDTVWVLADGKLDVRPVTVSFEEQEIVFISDGLEDGDEVITTSLATVTAGVELRRIEETP